MSWSEIGAYVLMFIMGAYAGSQFELSRLVAAARDRKPLDGKGRRFNVQEIHLP